MKSNLLKPIRQSVLTVSALLALLRDDAPAAAQPSFFQGKTVTIIQGRDPGGTGDLRTKAVVTFLQKYLPGNPTVIMEYMPGAGGRKGRQSSFQNRET